MVNKNKIFVILFEKNGTYILTFSNCVLLVDVNREKYGI